jgi:hypothetical protein
VRRAVDRVIARTALDHVLVGGPQLTATQLQLVQALAERDAIAAERDAIINSRTWRLTRPLRALHRLLRTRRY